MRLRLRRRRTPLAHPLAINGLIGASAPLTPGLSSRFLEHGGSAMPDEPPPKLWQHPLRQPASLPTRGADVRHEAAPALSGAVRRLARPRWGELAVTSNHTFLCGASHPEELVREAARLGHAGIALTDFETFGGAVRAHVAAREAVVGEQGGPHGA